MRGETLGRLRELGRVNGASGFGADFGAGFGADLGAESGGSLGAGL